MLKKYQIQILILGYESKVPYFGDIVAQINVDMRHLFDRLYLYNKWFYCSYAKCLCKGDFMKVNIRQMYAGVAVIIVTILFAVTVVPENYRFHLFLFTGVLLGYVLARSDYGFAGGVKRPYMTGNILLVKALLVMVAISSVFTFGIHFVGLMNGAAPAFAASEGQAVIAGSASVVPISILTVLGGVLFGMGMILGGGCASGTLTDLGSGFARAMIVLVFFVLGSVPGLLFAYEFNQTSLGEIKKIVYLPDVVGPWGALIVTLLGLLGIFAIALKYENARKKAKTYHAPGKEEEGLVIHPSGEQLLPYDDRKSQKIFSYEMYYKFFMRDWTLYVGGILLAILFVFIIATTGKSWGVTSGYANWGVAIFNALGFDMSHAAYAKEMDVIKEGLLNDYTSVRNVGIILGALVALLLAGKFKWDISFKAKDVALYALGGTLMGFGARLAGGCNVGAMYSAVANFSLSGWVFTIALVVGGILGLKLFEGKINIIPHRGKK